MAVLSKILRKIDTSRQLLQIRALNQLAVGSFGDVGKSIS